MTIQQALDLLNSKFKYQSDRRWLDVWKVLDIDQPMVAGDCEDYSLTLMWLLSDRSMARLLLNITLFRYRMWFVKSPRGEGHAIVKIGDLFYDNIQKKGATKQQLVEKGYKFVFPLIPPFVYLKLLISYTVGRLV